MPVTPDCLSQYPLHRLRIACRVCRREGCWSVARLAERYGAEINLGELLSILTAACKWQRPAGARPPRPYEPRCLAHYPELFEPERRD